MLSIFKALQQHFETGFSPRIKAPEAALQNINYAHFLSSFWSQLLFKFSRLSSIVKPIFFQVLRQQLFETLSPIFPIHDSAPMFDQITALKFKQMLFTSTWFKLPSQGVDQSLDQVIDFISQFQSFPTRIIPTWFY